MFPYAANLLRLAQNNRHLQPRVAIYYVTGQCNLNCAYCEDFGARINSKTPRPLPFEQVMHILRIVRSGVDALFLTGGEPLTHPEIDHIVTAAKNELNFREISLISNGFLLPQHEALLSKIDRLIISLDSCDPQLWSQTIGAPLVTAQTILTNIQRYASAPRQHEMIVNAVLTPETLPDAEKLLDFCLSMPSSSGAPPLRISFSPQAVNNWPRYELTVFPAYRTFIEKLLQLKHRGAPILGSDAYFNVLLNQTPYDCYPTLAPRIHPNGELAYPCRPLEKAENGQGGRPVNLLNVQTWEEAWNIAYQTYGQPPRNCQSCFQQCYIEPSLMASQPLALLGEWLRYPINRDVNLTTYVPG